MNSEQRGCHEQEGKLQRLGNTDQHCGEGHRDQQGENLFTLLTACRGVEGGRDTEGREDLRVTVQCETAAGEELAQRLVALGKFADVGRPILHDTVRGHSVTEHERRVDEVVQAGWNQDALQEGVDPHA